MCFIYRFSRLSHCHRKQLNYFYCHFRWTEEHCVNLPLFSIIVQSHCHKWSSATCHARTALWQTWMRPAHIYSYLIVIFNFLRVRMIPHRIDSDANEIDTTTRTIDMKRQLNVTTKLWTTFPSNKSYFAGNKFTASVAAWPTGYQTKGEDVLALFSRNKIHKVLSTYCNSLYCRFQLERSHHLWYEIDKRHSQHPTLSSSLRR